MQLVVAAQHGELDPYRVRGHEAAGEQRDLLLRHAGRIEAEIETLRTHLDYLRAKAALRGRPRPW